MDRCFVMQPFDRGKFDRRFDDVITPAIRDAELEPYRVDRDDNVEIPITDIETGIRNARVCLAEISTDNPNVWFELGYAIATKKEVVLICSNERKSRFPFDVQHRKIITYNTGSPSDFDELRSKLTARLSAILAKEPLPTNISSPVGGTEGLDAHEVALLAAVMQNQIDPNDPNEVVSTEIISDDMSRAGYTKIAVSLGIRSLSANSLIEVRTVVDEDMAFSGYIVTQEGEHWLLQNQDSLSNASLAFRKCRCYHEFHDRLVNLPGS
jgi:plasmid maintenance system antidote protein VapI